MKKILFAITSLTLGGAERVLVDIANRLSEEYDITIFTIYSGGELELQLDPKIKVENLIKKPYSKLNEKAKKTKPLQIMLERKKIYENIIKNDYDVEIAFLEGAPTRLLSVKNKNTKKIAWVHNDITQVFGKGIKATLKKIIDKKIYSKYDEIIFVSEDNKNKFEEIYNIDCNKKVIYNYIDSDMVLNKANEKMDIEFKKDTINFVTVSRLVDQKAIERLANVHSRLIKEKVMHNFYVIGDGPNRKQIEKIIEENGIKDTFILLGKQENPYPYIKNADCFALLSKFEGYPMVLLEAQILNKYIIITDTAARETIKNYTNSMIVGNNEEDIYLGLRKIIKNKYRYIKKKRKDNNKYDNDNIIKQIKEIIG